MATWLILGADDAERIGCSARLPAGLDRLMLREAIQLQRATGLDAARLSSGVQAGDFEAIAALVWLAIRRAGTDLAYEDLDFDLTQFDIEDDEADEGKAPAEISAT